MWGALSDERAGLSLTIAAGPRPRSHSWVRVPWDWQPCVNSRTSKTGGHGLHIYEYIPQKQGGPVIPQALGSLFVASCDSQGYVEVFDPASTWVCTELNWILLVITSRHRPHRKHSSIVVCIFVIATCLLSRSLQTVAVYSPYLAVVA
jgi:hypothetical protein